MLRLITLTRSWPVLIRITIVTAAVAVATAAQLPVEVEVPGEPFLLYFLLVVLSANFFGRVPGFLAVAETALASLLYFQPVYSIWLQRASDLLAVELYAFVAAVSTEAFNRLVDSALSERSEADSARLQHRETQERLTAVELMTRRLAESEAQFRATFDNAAVGMAHFRPDGRWLMVNDAMCRILGWPVEELITKTFQDVTHPDDVVAELAEIERLSSGSTDSYSVDKRSIRKDGTVVWIRRTVSCVRKPDRSIDYLVSVVEDISARKRAEEQTHLLMREANHRAKNTLGLVQAIARQTAAGPPEQFLERFTERIQALAANQDLLFSNKWQGVDLEDLLRAQLAHFADLIGSRITSAGPKLRLNPAAAQALGLAIHELATNAGKYGALSTDWGRIEIDWDRDASTFSMRWIERNGPPVRPPERRGFGRTVTETMAKRAVDGEVRLDFAPAGLEWHLTCPAENALESKTVSKTDNVDD